MRTCTCATPPKLISRHKPVSKALESLGLDLKTFQRLHIGPILFREESTYLREVGINEELTVTTELIKGREDGSHWTIRHEITKADGV